MNGKNVEMIDKDQESKRKLEKSDWNWKKGKALPPADPSIWILIFSLIHQHSNLNRSASKSSSLTKPNRERERETLYINTGKEREKEREREREWLI